MKQFGFCIMAFIAIGLASCSKSKMTPVSAKLNGPLKEYFEIVTREYAPKDGYVSIEIQRIAYGFPFPWQEEMEAGSNDGKFEFGFSVEFQDADGNVVSKDDTDIAWDYKELAGIADLDIDESATITFKCGKGAKKFKMGSTFKVHGEIEQTLNLEGNIGKYAIMMTMHIAPNATVTGAYYYKRNGPGNYLYVKGKKSDDRITLNEYTKDGQQTGTYNGKLKDGVYSGSFNAKSGGYEFVLYPTEMAAIDLSTINFDSFLVELAPTVSNNFSQVKDYDDDYDDDDDDDDDDDSWFADDDEGDESVDEFIAEYEKFWKNYIAVLKKVQNNDMSAMVDYIKMLEQYNEYARKLSKMQGKVSISQLERLNKMNLDMLNEMQKLQ